MKKVIASILFLLVAAGCTDNPYATEELPGMPTELSAADRDAAKGGFSEMQTWAMWYIKGLKLSHPEMGGQIDYGTALYCFNQAMKAWPKKLPASASEARRRQHTAEPLDTIREKGWVYLKLKQPQLALIYFKRFNAIYPNLPNILDGIAQAEAML